MKKHLTTLLSTLLSISLSVFFAISGAFAQGTTDNSRFGETIVNSLDTTSAYKSILNSNTSRNIAVDNSGNIYVAYYCNEGIRVAKSVNQGKTFSSNVLATTDSAEVEITVSDNGTVFIVYALVDKVYICKSTDSAKTFSQPILVGIYSSDIDGLLVSSFSVHMATDYNHIYIVTSTGTDIYVSSDNGETFSTKVITNTNYMFSDVMVDKTTHDVFVIRDKPAVIYYKSSDYGLTFNEEPYIPEVNDSQIMVFFSVASLGISSDNSRYIYMAGSSTNGYRINTSDNTTIPIPVPNCSEDQGRSVTSDTKGNVATGYTNGDTVYFSVSNDNGETFSDGVEICTSDSAIASFNPTNGDLMFLYENGGNICLKVYGGYMSGYDIAPEVSDITFNTLTGNTSKIISLTNNGDTSTVIDSVSVSGDFTVSCNKTLPYTLKAGESVSITVKCNQTADQTSSGVVTVSYGGGSGSCEIPVSVTNQLPPNNTETIKNVQTKEQVEVSDFDDIYNTENLVTDSSKGITSEELAGSRYINIKVSVVDKTKDDAEKATEIISTANNRTIGKFLDISIEKTIIDNGSLLTSTKLTEVPALMTFNIELDESLQGKKSYSVFRNHDNHIDEITTTPNDAGEYIKVADDKKSLELHIRKFSTYAIGYTNSDDSGNGGNSGDSGNSGNSGESSPSVPSAPADIDDDTVTTTETENENTAHGNPKTGRKNIPLSLLSFTAIASAYICLTAKKK